MSNVTSATDLSVPSPNASTDATEVSFNNERESELRRSTRQTKINLRYQSHTSEDEQDFWPRTKASHSNRKRNKLRTRNNGQSRVRYNYDDEDYEYNEDEFKISAMSSRGRLRKLKGHARAQIATH